MLTLSTLALLATIATSQTVEQKQHCNQLYLETFKACNPLCKKTNPDCVKEKDACKLSARRAYSDCMNDAMKLYTLMEELYK